MPYNRKTLKASSTERTKVLHKSLETTYDATTQTQFEAQDLLQKFEQINIHL